MGNGQARQRRGVPPASAPAPAPPASGSARARAAAASPAASHAAAAAPPAAPAASSRATAAAARVAASSTGRASPDGAAEPERVGWYAMARMGYAAVVDAIIRPPRAKYTDRDLGPLEFEFRGRVFRRSDLEVRNPRGMRIVCSHWEPAPFNRPSAQLPCVVYLHGNSSCRVGCLENLEVVLAEGCTMFSFDFSGSGASEGEHVTLGWAEKDDLATVVDYLRRCGTVSSIALWGRSMGAATALMHAPRDPSIAGMILDSPFTDLRQLAIELVEMVKAQTGYKVPGFMVGAAIRMVRSTVMKRTRMDIFALQPIKDVDKAFIPALFVAGEGDTFIAPHHSRQIYEKYAGDKNIVIVPGDHNSPRPRFFQDSAAIFLRQVLHVPPGAALDESTWNSGSPSVFGAQRSSRRAKGGTKTAAAARKPAAAPATATAADSAHVPGTGSASSGEELPDDSPSVLAPPRSLLASWRAAGSDATLAALEAEDAMIQQALAASLITASLGTVRADMPSHSPAKPPLPPRGDAAAAASSVDEASTAPARGPDSLRSWKPESTDETLPAASRGWAAAEGGRGTDAAAVPARSTWAMRPLLNWRPGGPPRAAARDGARADVAAASVPLADPSVNAAADELADSIATDLQGAFVEGMADAAHPAPVHVIDGRITPAASPGMTPSFSDADLQRAIELSLAAETAAPGTDGVPPADADMDS